VILGIVLTVIGLLTALGLYSGIRGSQYDNKTQKRLVALAMAEVAMRNPMRSSTARET
jgi:type II secretory pathway pseudopilin PulG